MAVICLSRGCQFESDTASLTFFERGTETMAKSYMEILEERGIHPFIEDDGRESLMGFDPKIQYAMADKTGPVFKSHHQHRIEVGKNSNLISDMCWFGATSEELVRAIRHGMVLLDAEKYFLNWKQSAKDHGIEELYKKYEGVRDCRCIGEKSAKEIGDKIGLCGYRLNGFAEYTRRKIKRGCERRCCCLLYIFGRQRCSSVNSGWFIFRHLRGVNRWQISRSTGNYGMRFSTVPLRSQLRQQANSIISVKSAKKYFKFSSLQLG